MNKYISIILATVMLAFASCSTMKKNKNTTIGAGTGIIVGGALGGLIGKNNNNTAGGIIIGAALGGVAGAAIGKYMDKQKRELEQKLGETATVERVGEGIKVTFDSGLLFSINSSNLTPEMRNTLKEFAATLKEYPETNVLIDGHTDSTGTEKHNMNLSEQRANSVSSYLSSQGVASSRLGIRGFGESQPIANNGTEAGRKQNRRVEVALWASEDLKQKAQQGQLNP